MPIELDHAFPRLQQLPNTFPLEGAVRIEIEEGVPLFRASRAVQERIGALVIKQRASTLTAEEEKELDRYEEIDDYLSFLNRVVRNLAQTPPA
jgi:hypothetical protein